MKLCNGDEIEVGGEKYRVIDGELFQVNEGNPSLEITVVPRDVPVPLDEALKAFYLKKGYDICPSCGQGKEAQGGTGCGQYHYGTYCEVKSQ